MPGTSLSTRTETLQQAAKRLDASSFGEFVSRRRKMHLNRRRKPRWASGSSLLLNSEFVLEAQRRVNFLQYVRIMTRDFE